MQASSTDLSASRISSSAAALRAGSLLLAGLATACGGSSGGTGQSGIPGDEVPKPGTDSTFFVDENQSGSATSYVIEDVRWGRLVDIHEIDDSGDRVEDPVWRDFVVEPGILSNGTTYILDRNPITQRERLTILARKRNLPVGDDSAEFDALVAAATDALPEVAPKSDDGSSAPPFTTIPRNATVVVRFGDALDDDAAANMNLRNNVRVLTGYPPETPYSARVVFDPNHGAIVGGAFHSTRVLVDMTISQAEANELPTPQGVNQVGLPESLSSSSATNLSVRVPTEVDVGSGQFTVLTNLAGVPVDADQEIIDPLVPTLDVVRAMESGNSEDPSNGYLTDNESPRVIGGWAALITSAVEDATGTPGRDFLIDFTFETICANAPAAGDVITIGAHFLEVTADGTLNGSDVTDLAVRTAADTPDPLVLQGNGLYQAPFHPSLALDTGCWITFLPQAGVFPDAEVSTSSQILARFSEPMDPKSLSPYGGFLVVTGAAVGSTTTANASNIVVAEVLPNSDLTVFSFGPSLPMPHAQGVADPLHVELGEARDLAGNTLRHLLPFVDFTLDPIEGSQLNDSVVLRFGATDEYAPNEGDPDGRVDLRGQFFYDTAKGSILPRPVAFTGWPADRSNPIPAFMTTVPGGVLTPLTPLGAKLHAVWRYCDVGWNLRDETKYNLDVFGLSWSPVAGLVVADFYDEFEIRLGHSRFLPDEEFDANGLPFRPLSGLPAAPGLYDSNYLAGSGPQIVHSRALGYTVNPASLFQSTTGTPMMPYPLNHTTAPFATYTWRDTSNLALGATGDATQRGVPLGIELQLGVDTSAVLAGFGQVPTIGLPLLIEVRCYPADRGLGLNAFDVSIANPLSPAPNFRAFSAGGINTLGNPVIVLPDLENQPSGGFNPNSTPPGLVTANNADNVFYVGQLDTVVRVSRVHTVWLDTKVGASPTWRVPVLDPAPADQPGGTQVRLDFRGASGFSGIGTPTAPFDASTLNVYGDQTVNTPQQLTDWNSSIGLVNGFRFIQVRMTFVNNVTTGLSPELTALALAYEHD